MRGRYPLRQQLALRHARLWRHDLRSQKSRFCHLQAHQFQFSHLRQWEPVHDYWTEWHGANEQAALGQGWLISQTSGDDGHAPYEIQRVDNAAETAALMGIDIPQLDTDREAVLAMRAAYGRGEYHAYLAREIILRHSTQEFVDWHMARWTMYQPIRI